MDDLLTDARAGLMRLEPHAAAAAAARGAMLVDTRPLEQRSADGVVPGALIIDRNVLEWRLDPLSPYRLDEVTGHDQQVIVMCNEGYSSSLVAAQLQAMGFKRATDVIGGFQAWRSRGLPVVGAAPESA